jgi:hypothetical protein
MIAQFIAESTQPDTMISGTWLIGAIGALSTAAALIIGKLQVDKVKRDKTSTRIEDQPISISLVETLATKEEMKELEGRLVDEIKKLEGSISKERDIARTANGNLHARIDKSAEAMAEMKGQLIQISANTSRLIDMAMGKQPRTPR